jgi:hypothetical protein
LGSGERLGFTDEAPRDFIRRGEVGSDDSSPETAGIHGDVDECGSGTNRGAQGHFRTRRDKVEAMASQQRSGGPRRRPTTWRRRAVEHAGEEEDEFVSSLV